MFEALPFDSRASRPRRVSYPRKEGAPMTTGKATAWTLALIGVIALGVWVAPKIADRASSPTAVTEAATPVPEEPIAAPAKPARTTPATARRAELATTT